MVLRLFIISLSIICVNCSVPVTEKQYSTVIELNEQTETNARENRAINKLANDKMWINNGIKIYTDTISEVDYFDTLTSYNFLKYLHPWEAQFYGNNKTPISGPRYYEGLYTQIDTVTTISEENVQNYFVAIDSAFHYFDKNCDEKGDICAGRAIWKSKEIIKTYLLARNSSWNKAEELLIANSKLEPSQYLNLHAIAIPVLYEKYGKESIMKEVVLLSSSETTQYIHEILFDLNTIRSRFSDKNMTWEAYFEMAFEHYEIYGLD
ncbi:MAG: hypothetical protein ACI8ZM_000394 [Crocinitomix sp.]|jgi:hypothetical protein